MGWAVKEYCSNLERRPEWSLDSVKHLIELKTANKRYEEFLFDREAVRQMRSGLDRSSLFIWSLGKPRIWKPSKYVPSRSVVLAESVEDLKYLYQT